MKLKSSYPGYQYELVDDVIHILRIFKHNLCVTEHYVDGLMDSIGTIRYILNQEHYNGLKHRMALALADLFIGQIEEERSTVFEEELLETYLNPDMELMSK